MGRAPGLYGSLASPIGILYYDVMLYYTILYYTLLYSTILYYTLIYECIVAMGGPSAARPRRPGRR